MSASQLLPPDADVGRRTLATVVREVNRQIAGGASLGVVALACECESRACKTAFEVPVTLFEVVDARPGFFLVAPGHETPASERAVRRERSYLVVERV